MNGLRPDLASLRRIVRERRTDVPVVVPVVARVERVVEPVDALAVLDDGSTTFAGLFETPDASYVVPAARRLLTGADALDAARAHVVQHVADIGVLLPHFIGGVLGMIVHEHASVLEPTVPLAAGAPPVDVAETVLAVVEELVACSVDGVQVIGSLRVDPGETQDVIEAAYHRVAARVRALAGRLERCDTHRALRGPALAATGTEEPASVPDRAGFERRVATALEHVRAGDVVQVVLSRRFDVRFHGDPLDVHRVLRRDAASPYHVALRVRDVHVVGASPERLVRVDGDHVSTHPIAGTRPRGRNEPHDAALERELRSCPKERAEHVMLVDLGRNDVGRVCRPGSVRVAQLAQLERHARVMHLVSHVTGVLDPGRQPVDALGACFPAGTLSGAPKVRALQLIAELEPDRRGVYGGALAYIGHGHALDSAITIRTAVIGPDGSASVQAGAGIVAASDPAAEADETFHKARSVLEALAAASIHPEQSTAAGQVVA